MNEQTLDELFHEVDEHLDRRRKEAEDKQFWYWFRVASLCLLLIGALFGAIWKLKFSSTDTTFPSLILSIAIGAAGVWLAAFIIWVCRSLSQLDFG